jgi:cellobiose phosphorylase
MGNISGVNRGVKAIILDGKALSGNAIPLLSDGGRHQINVLMGIGIATIESP